MLSSSCHRSLPLSSSTTIKTIIPYRRRRRSPAFRYATCIHIDLSDAKKSGYSPDFFQKILFRAIAGAVSVALVSSNYYPLLAADAASSPPEVFKGGAEMTENVPSASVANEDIVEEAWEIVNESFLGNVGSRPWSPEKWLKEKEYIFQNNIQTRSRAHNVIRKMLASLGDPYTRFSCFMHMVLHLKWKVLQDGKGDELLSVNGLNVAGKSAFEVSSMLQGPKETFVTIEVRHGDSGPTHSIKVQRQNVARTPVFYRLENTGKENVSVGYVHIKEFNALARKDLIIALKNLLNSGASYLVLDLRDNLGGLVQAGIEVAKLFLDKGETVIYTVGRDPEVQKTIVADAAPFISNPVIVLVNNRTASASEIVASALHDNCKGVLVGEKTYGKGLIQSIYELHDGSGVAVTIGKYVTPNHMDINGNGIKPDFFSLPAFHEVADYLSRCQLRRME